MNWVDYAVTLATVFFINLILILGVNLQLGLLGLPNLSFIIFLGAGAYTVSILSIGPATPGSLEQYFFGTSLPFPIPLIIATLVGIVLALMVGALVLYKMRGHTLAIVTLITVIVAWTLVNGSPNFLAGANGLFGIPQPLHSLASSVLGYGLVFLGLVAFVGCLCFVFNERFFKSPLGRTARAIRENERAAIALGKSAYRVRLIAVMCGGAMAALSGALLAEYSTIWTPAPWSLDEVFPAIGAMIVGGRGNNWGAALGTFFISIVVGQGVVWIPVISNDPGRVAALQWLIYGVVFIGFLWFRPKGLIPERKARWSESGLGGRAAARADGSHRGEEGRLHQGSPLVTDPMST